MKGKRLAFIRSALGHLIRQWGISWVTSPRPLPVLGLSVSLCSAFIHPCISRHWLFLVKWKVPKSRRDNKVLIKHLSLEFQQGWFCLKESWHWMTAFVMKGIMEGKKQLTRHFTWNFSENFDPDKFHSVLPTLSLSFLISVCFPERA